MDSEISQKATRKNAIIVTVYRPFAVNHIPQTKQPITPFFIPKFAGRGLQPVPATPRDRRLKNIILIHHDKHKICPAANSQANVISFQAPEYINN